MLSHSSPRQSTFPSRRHVGRKTRFKPLAPQPPRVSPLQPDVPRDRGGGRGHEWFQRLLSKFRPSFDRSKTALILDFEKPLINLDSRIKEARYCPEPSSWHDDGTSGAQSGGREWRRCLRTDPSTRGTCQTSSVSMPYRNVLLTHAFIGCLATEGDI